jgi:LytS/YehU family sensor histidine kinase
LIVFFSVNTVILVIKDLILTREKNSIIEMENAQLKMKNLEAVNERLKQQIHPHFLFNSLSTLKTLITSSPEKAEEYLIKLSGFLRTAVSANALNAVKISKELNACIDYLDMQKIRFGEALQFEVNIPGNIMEGFWIPVFSLQVLVENAIKHNAFTIQSPLYINIGFVESCIVVSNNIQPKTVAETSAGTGLANLNERYKILSGEEIIIQKTDTNFSVSLKIFDNESCNYRR